jgi:nucleoside-diphosphate-sugar epimerase/GT2 family glycosyltransferase
VTPLVISASLVLYKPDLPTVERTLLALHEAVRLARRDYALQLSLTLVDNSDDSLVHSEVLKWMEGIRAAAPDWTLELLRSAGNVGYGRGNNLVIATTDSDYHIVINPDLFVEPEAMLEALRFMEANPEVGLLSPAVYGENGERQYLCKRNPTLFVMFLRSFAPAWLQSRFSLTLNSFEMRDCDYEKPIQPVEYPTGCFMFFRTAPLQAIGGFDPDFFLHYEDADIGRRLLQVSRTVYVPRVRVVHQWARDTHRSLRAKLVTVRSGWLYWKKWGGLFSSKPMAEPTAVWGGRAASFGSALPASSAPRVLVTGASGFIGQAVCGSLPSRGYRVVGAVRGGSPVAAEPSLQYLKMGEIDERTDWGSALLGIDSVVHLAARVHFMQETAADPLAEFRRVNVALALNLARQAASAGVRRFVFISSIKVNGETTSIGQPFTAEDVPRPLDAYGVSKMEAEQALQELSRQTGMQLVIIRPVLVYGPGVKANFHEMMRWLSKGIPLPLGSLHNRRSLVALDNLVDLITRCLSHPAAANQIFLVSDGEDMTVTDLLRRTAAAFDKPARLLPIPMFGLRMAGRLFRRESAVQRLCDTLQVDISKTRRMLDWEPPVSADSALRKAARQLLEK